MRRALLRRAPRQSSVRSLRAVGLLDPLRIGAAISVEALPMSI